MNPYHHPKWDWRKFWLFPQAQWKGFKEPMESLVQVPCSKGDLVHWCPAFWPGSLEDEIGCFSDWWAQRPNSCIGILVYSLGLLVCDSWVEEETQAIGWVGGWILMSGGAT